MFAGINVVSASLRLILARAFRQGLKWGLRRDQNNSIPKNVNCITVSITLEGIEKIKTEKKLQQHSQKDISFTNAVRKRYKLWIISHAIHGYSKIATITIKVLIKILTIHDKKYEIIILQVCELMCLIVKNSART